MENETQISPDAVTHELDPVLAERELASFQTVLGLPITGDGWITGSRTARFEETYSRIYSRILYGERFEIDGAAARTHTSQRFCHRTHKLAKRKNRYHANWRAQIQIPCGAASRAIEMGWTGRRGLLSSEFHGRNGAAANHESESTSLRTSRGSNGLRSSDGVTGICLKLV
jgi:hypothetical protein